MNDYVIRFTPREDDVSYEQLVQLVRDAVEDGPEPSGWKILQKGEFDSMAESMSKEKEFVRLVLERERDRPLLSFDSDAEEMKRIIKVTLGNNQFGPFDYVIPDDNCTESMIHDSGKKWINSIYCPDLPEGSITNRSEDSIGGVAKIVTNDRNCKCKCYGWEEIERELASEQRARLKDIYISPEAMEELRDWLPTQEQADELFESEGLNNCLGCQPIKTTELGENTFVSINGQKATNVENFNAKLKERVVNYEPTNMVD